MNPAEHERNPREVARASLVSLAYNLRWAWEPSVRELFSSLAPRTWEATHNPVAVINALADDSGVIDASAARIAEAKAALDSYLTAPARLSGGPSVAYLCAEFALAECLPIYSGGLGVLAGDHLKAASDLGLPLVGVGLFYRYGYFRQALDESGWQREHYDHLDPEDLPLHLMVEPGTSSPLRVPVPFPDRTVVAQVWCAQVGRVPLYLLDTDLPENRQDDRWITGHLYGGDQDTRIRQEIVLGIGGARLLRRMAPDAQPCLYHMNEGHAAFVALELARERIEEGGARNLAEAARLVAPCLAFTTHTPVAAGHDTFPNDLVEAYFAGYREALGVSHEELMALGRENPRDYGQGFSMTVLALRSAARRNGVSQLHGVVSREMWGGVGVGMEDAPATEAMGAITNGVHTPTWIGPEIARLLDEQLGRRWRDAPDDPSRWEPLPSVPARVLWSARTAQRARLLERVRSLLPLADGISAERTLVVGFARRFATYKRAALLLEDPERLHALLSGDPVRPVLLLFAGKAHPRDEPGKTLMQRIVEASRDPRFQGRLVFLEGYDLNLARDMVQGCDVWLNTPRRPLEASGTSGMKAALNGAQHLSELDGWWDEAYRPDLGWALGQGIRGDLPAVEVDRLEAQQLIDLMEREVVPLFFDRDEEDVPTGWTRRVATSISMLAPVFSTHRMVAEYSRRVYEPAATDARQGAPRPSLRDAVPVPLQAGAAI